MKRISTVSLFIAAASLGMTGCVCTLFPSAPTATPVPTFTPVPTATPLPFLIGAHSGNVVITSISTYNDGTPTLTANYNVLTTLVYNSSSVLTQWVRTLPSGAIVSVANPAPGTITTYDGAVSGINGTIVQTIAQANYSAATSSLSGSATFGSGSTGYTGNGNFMVTAAVTSGGVKYIYQASWTLLAPSGSPIVNVSESGSAVLP